MSKFLKNIIFEDYYAMRFCSLSANLIHFFKKYSIQESVEIAKHLFLQQETVKKEGMSMSNLKKIINKHGEILNSQINKSKIIYTFHLGSYRLVPMILLALGYDVKLLVADNIYNDELKDYLKVTKKINKVFNVVSKLTVVSNQDRSLLYNLKKLSNNEKVFIYFDGNIGTGKFNNSSKNYYYQKFFDQELYFHKGTGFLNYFSKQPLLGIIVLHSKNDVFNIKILEHNESKFKSMNLREYSLALTKDVVSNLENLVKANFLQWENILYVHYWLKGHYVETKNYEQGETEFKDLNTDFNIYRYFPFKFKGLAYLFDKKTYLTYPIESQKFIKYTKICKKFYFK